MGNHSVNLSDKAEEIYNKNFGEGKKYHQEFSKFVSKSLCNLEENSNNIEDMELKKRTLELEKDDILNKIKKIEKNIQDGKRKEEESEKEKERLDKEMFDINYTEEINFLVDCFGLSGGDLSNQKSYYLKRFRKGYNLTDEDFLRVIQKAIEYQKDFIKKGEMDKFYDGNI